MTKDELEKYARDNRKRLEAQEVKLGDIVKILRGELAGENGVVVGIIAFDGNDCADPYFEVDMNCEVPDKYKCRKHLLNPRNVVGGLSVWDFEVIGNRAPEKPTDEIKVGDIVRVSDDAPKDIWRNRIGAVNPSHYKGLPFEVTQIYDGGLERMAHLDSTDGFMHIFIPVRFLKPYYSAEDVRRMEEEQNKRAVEFLREHSDNEVDNPEKENDIDIHKEADEWVKNVTDAMEKYRKGFAKITSELVDFDWLQYRVELASKIAVAYAEKGRYKPSEIGKYAVMVANDVVDNLKKEV